MIKDNHRELAAFAGPDSIGRAVRACRETFPKLDVEVEADTLDEVEAALAAGADIILLDNMSNQEMEDAVRLVGGRALLEASGGITLERLPSLAGLGVDFISVGALTHSAPAVDIALDVIPPAGNRPA
jgi:nicotinate-nucleotide pyrophosphorylase (carboxylating)